MKINNRNYIPAKIDKAATLIEIETIIEFCQFVESHGIKDIFVTPPPSHFTVLYNNAVLQIKTLDYASIDDYKKAVQNKLNGFLY